MALVSANQFQLTPDIAGAVSKGLGAFQAVKAGQAREQQLGFQQQQLGLQQQKADQELLQQQAKGVFNAAVEINNLPTNEAKVNATEARFQQLSSEGKDTSDTRALLDLYRSGNFEEADTLLKSTIQTGQQTGFLKAPQAPKQQAKFEKGKGGLVFNPNEGTFAIDPVATAEIERVNTIKANRVKQDAQGLNKPSDIKGVNADIDKLTKGSRDIFAAAKDLESLEKTKSPAAKLAAVFKFMKVLDPTSVVRETEQGQVYEAEGAAAALAGSLNSLLGQGKLSDAGFADLVNTAKTLTNSGVAVSTEAVEKLLNTYGDALNDKQRVAFQARVPTLFEIGEQPPLSGTANTGSQSVFDKTPTAAERTQEAGQQAQVERVNQATGQPAGGITIGRFQVEVQ